MFAIAIAVHMLLLTCDFSQSASQAMCYVVSLLGVYGMLSSMSKCSLASHLFSWKSKPSPCRVCLRCRLVGKRRFRQHRRLLQSRLRRNFFSCRAFTAFFFILALGALYMSALWCPVWIASMEKPSRPLLPFNLSTLLQSGRFFVTFVFASSIILLECWALV